MKSMTFEKALEKLAKIVEDLETGDLPLETSLKKYEEGITLAHECQMRLDKAKEKIEKLVKSGGGTFKTEEFMEDKD